VQCRCAYTRPTAMAIHDDKVSEKKEKREIKKWGRRKF
jgi:hypothetical protein